MTKAIPVEVVDMRALNQQGNLRAFADVKIADSLIVKGLTVMLGKKGVFVSMPRKSNKEGRWFDVVKATDDRLKESIETKVLERYEASAKQGRGTS